MKKNLKPIFILFSLILAPSVSLAASPPYPYSSYITDITWDSDFSYEEYATGSDNWPLTWADDNNIYTSYGDGFGFMPKVSTKLSLGYAKVSGDPTDFRGINIRSSSGETGNKSSGMLMVNGVLYMYVRNAGNSTLAWSTDHAETWTWADWRWPDSMGFPAFLNFGKNYAGARDNYVYVYSPDGDSAYCEVDDMILARVPKDRIGDKNAYEFFVRRDGSNAVWTQDFSRRGSVFHFDNAVNRLDVVYNAPLGRYLLTLRSRGDAQSRACGGEDQFSIYEAPEPWGPWKTVYYTEIWDAPGYEGHGQRLENLGSSGGWGESQHIPSKWISSDGKRMYLVFSGGDSFAVRGFTVSISGSPPPPSSTGNADLNNDSRVDVIDLGILLSYWNSTLRPPADLDQDGHVDGVDLDIILSHWGGTGASPSPPPSPPPPGDGVAVWFEEDFNAYTDTQEFINDKYNRWDDKDSVLQFFSIADDNILGIGNTRVWHTDQVPLDHCKPGRDGDRTLLFPQPYPREIWVEMYVKFSPNFRTDHCEDNPDGSGEEHGDFKFIQFHAINQS